MDKPLLYKLGLNNKEIEIYLFLNENGVQSVKQISDRTGINRTTTYRYLDSLREKGLITWLVEDQGTKAKATEPENLQSLLDSQKKKVAEIESKLPQFISELQVTKPVEKFATQVRYYKGKNGVEQMVWNRLRAKENLRSFTPFGIRKFIDKDFEDEFEKECAAKGLRDKIITNDSNLNYIKNKLIPAYRKTLNIRTISNKQFYITNDIAIYNNVVAIISLEKDNLVGIEIENEEIAKTQKSIFDIVWETALSF